jgi:hypothetical protein
MKVKEFCVAIVENDPYYNYLFSYHFRNFKCAIQCYDIRFKIDRHHDAFSYLNQKLKRYDIVILDFFVSGKSRTHTYNGRRLVNETLHNNPDCGIILVSGSDDLVPSAAIEGRSNCDYLSKKYFDKELFRMMLNRKLIQTLRRGVLFHNAG